MKIEHLRTVGDGFCFNHYWPMWSQLLAEILDCEWQNFSLPGLGNEAITNIVIDQLSAEDLPNTLWVIQWAAPKRLDFRVDTIGPAFLKKTELDPVYYKNFITTAQGRRYWSSSASILPWVADHRELITVDQYKDRQKLFELAATHSLAKSGVKWQYISTPAMMSFLKQSKYLDLDVGEIQPVSSVHLDFLEQFVLPGLEIDTARLENIREKTVQTDQERKHSNQYVPWDRNMYQRV
jgi:hypothetical protein